jgi:hypothetical protein
MEVISRKVNNCKNVNIFLKSFPLTMCLTFYILLGHS